VEAPAADGPGQAFGVLTDAAEGLVEVLALLGGLRPGVTAGAALPLLNAVHEGIPVGRFILAEAPARLLFEAELVLGAGDDRRELVARLLPALLLAMQATIVEERPRLAAVVDW
jgi:hypothetical protein